jgi:tetratricopeptide (TPR) repeat protein
MTGFLLRRAAPALVLAAGALAVPAATAAEDGRGMEDLLRMALELEGQGHYVQAIRLYREARFLDFEDVRPSLGLARAYLAQDMLARSEEALRPVLLQAPHDPLVLAIHGEILYRTERLEEARRAWSESLSRRDDPAVRSRLARVERELRYTGEYKDALTTNFVMKYEGETRSPDEGALLRVLETEYANLRRALGDSPDAPIVVVLYPKQEFREATLAPERAQGLYDGKVRLPFRGVDPEDEKFRRVLVHELTHAYIHYLGGDNVPRWLHEGLAEYMEGARLGSQEKAFAREYLSERGSGWGYRFSYERALSLVTYMVDRGGLSGVTLVLEGLRNRRGLDQALLDVYGRTYDELADEWGRDLVGRNS